MGRGMCNVKVTIRGTNVLECRSGMKAHRMSALSHTVSAHPKGQLGRQDRMATTDPDNRFHNDLLAKLAMARKQAHRAPFEPQA